MPLPAQLPAPLRLHARRSAAPPVCALCRFLLLRSPAALNPAKPTRRNHSTSTGINASTAADARRHARSALAQALLALSKTRFTDEGRVRLAVRCLEQDDAPVRVAVLGPFGSTAKLLSTLLADPLAVDQEEERAWSGKLSSWAASGEKGRALLLRYGPFSKITSSTPISILCVPSAILKSSNLEILLSQAPSSGSDLSVLTFAATETPGARVLQYPVHKALVFAGEGEDGLSSLLTLRPNASRTLLSVLSLPGMPSTAKGNPGVKIVNLPLAIDAVERLQQSIGNATIYEKEWLESGVDLVRKWILAGVHKTENSNIKPAVKQLISTIIEESESLINQEEEMEKKQPRALAATTITSTSDDSTTLSSAITSWSHDAHTELQDGLTTAFKSAAWKSLSWWKLPWTIDDVAANAQEVITTGFLPVSQQEYIFLTGRITGAGFNPSSELSKPHATPTTILPPQHLAHAKTHILTTVIPTLHSTATTLFLKTLTSTTLSAATSALLILADISLYSSLSIAALGTVGSVKWAQKRWDREKRRFGDAVRECGREGIVEGERWAWGKLRYGGAVPAEEEERRGGKRVVKDVKAALTRVE